MTPAQIRTERDYRIEERLSILCGSSTPTPVEMAMAVADADEWESREMGIASPERKAVVAQGLAAMRKAVGL